MISRLELGQVRVGVVETLGHERMSPGRSRRIGGARFVEAARAQAAAVTPAAGAAFRIRIVAAVSELVAEPERKALAHDLGLREPEQRRQNPQRPSVDAGPRRQRRDALERLEIFRTAVRVAGVVQGVDADHDGLRPDHFRPAERQRQEDRVSGGHVRGRDAGVIEIAVLGDLTVAEERGAAERREVDVELDVARDAQMARDLPRRGDLARVHLAVPHGQGVQLVPLGAHHRARGVGVQPAAQQKDRFHDHFQLRVPSCHRAYARRVVTCDSEPAARRRVRTSSRSALPA